MNKRSRLVPKEADQFLNQYREEIAQEFGVYHSTVQTEQQASINSVTKKVMDKKPKEKK
ncbi:small, acid-soluble spore protein, alpha/beta type [Evansella sp. AB-rgal1]|uniref:small, acid-soluble spore protein, alpha/beta type n=1 Tax=Evansella sp. AB-rgal1 TaxID=3242696 RepID=UPI00359F0C3D